MNLENTQQGQQDAGVNLPGGEIESPSTPVEVDIDAGTVTPEPETPAARTPAAPAEKTPLPRPQARIQHLTHERDEAWGVAERLKQELAAARAEAAQNKAEAAAAERMGMENMIARTKAEVAAAEAAMRKAKDDGDADAEMVAHKRLARAVAEEADADAWAAANPKQEPAPRQQQQQQQPREERQPEPPLAEPVRNFISENAWFNPVQIGADGRPVVDRGTGRMVSNPDYDPYMHNVAMMEDQKIQREIQIGQLAKNYVGTPEYFERVKTRVLTEFPDAFEPPEEETPPAPRSRGPQMAAPKQAAAPSSRQIPGQQPQRQGTKMRLDGEEASLVRSLVDNGTMIYPRNHPDAGKRGQKMSYDDAYVKYATEKKADQANR